MAEVILVQPKIGYWDDYRSHPALPLALLSASRCVAKEFGVVLIDTRIDKNWKISLKQELENNPLCVGITSMTGNQISCALEISNYVKAISKVPVVWGGIHGSLLPESTLENKNIDILVKGEGEYSFLELVRALAAKTSLNDIRGVWYKKDGKIVRNPDREFLHLDNLPALPLFLIDLKKYLPIFKERRTFFIETSRGCPNCCAFCYNAVYNRSNWRAFSSERVIQELKYLSKSFNIGSFYFVDDNFFVDLKRAYIIAQGIIEKRLNIFYEVQGITINSALKMNEDYLKLLVKSGMKKVHFGVESASERILKMLNKKLDISDVIKINRNWRRYNIIVQYNFMCGFPGETIEDICKTKELAFQLMRENPNALISPFCPYIPYPGTALYQKSLDDGFIFRKKIGDWSETDYGDNLWVAAEEKKIINSLFFASQFLDKHRSKDMVKSKIIKILIELYRPIARFRVRHLFFNFMPELKIKDILFK